MPKKDKYDEEVERMLHKVLGRYHDILFQAANTKKDEDVNGFRERFIKEMQDGVMGFKIAAKDVVDKYIPNLSSVGFSTVSSSPLERSSKNPTVDPSRITKMLQSFGANYSGEEIKLTTYVRMVGSLTTSVDKYRERIDNEIKRRESQGKVTTIMDLQDMIMRDLKGDDITSVKYENGTQMPVDKYAAMLARTTRAETENLSMIQQALREGIDLVECDEISPTCDTCAVYQGRIYSISGKDSRYPALYQTAFKSGYSIIHPNCRHSWFPYHAELYSDAEKREALDRSNRSWRTDTGGRYFQQTEIQRTEFARGQQLMRQWNSELVEYERMRQHYEERKEEPPYKTLGAFRREVRKPMEQQSPAMKAWKRHRNDEHQYNHWISIVGSKNMPETFAKFEEMKYNRQEEFALLKGYKEAQQKQNIHALVSFKVYKAVSNEIDKTLVGKNFDGITIKGKKTHFIDRVIGEYQESDYKQSGKRQGVKIADILDCLQSEKKVSRMNADGSVSLTYVSEKCKVTVNPETGILIQTNPVPRRNK